MRLFVLELILTLSPIGIFKKSAVFKAERPLAISNCSRFLLDGALDLKLGINVHWAIAFQNQALKFQKMLLRKRGGVSKLPKIAIFLAFLPQN